MPLLVNTGTYHHQPPEDMEEHAIATRSWVSKVPIGLGLCPWAGKSNNRGLLNIITCESECREAVAQLVENEVELLTREGTPPLSTTLVVCPHVKAWEEDFKEFDEFVRTGIRQHNNDTTHNMQHVTLVAFHPSFCRWYGLPEGFGVGSVVDSYYGRIGQKSTQTTPATIIETNNKAFGLRKVKVRFHDTTLEGIGNRQEHYVPTDWIEFTNNNESYQAPLLPDNIMHRSPYPTIHIIMNRDLSSTCIRDVSRVKRLNAQRMMKLGWDGLEHHLAK